MVTRIIACGKREEGDAGAGALVVQRLNELGVYAYAYDTGRDICDCWHGADRVILIDTIHTGAIPGSVSIWEANTESMRPENFRSFSHGTVLSEALRIGLELMRVPERMVVYSIEVKKVELRQKAPAKIEEAALEAANSTFKMVGRRGAQAKARPPALEASFEDYSADLKVAAS